MILGTFKAPSLPQGPFIGTLLEPWDDREEKVATSRGQLILSSYSGVSSSKTQVISTWFVPKLLWTSSLSFPESWPSSRIILRVSSSYSQSAWPSALLTGRIFFQHCLLELLLSGGSKTFTWHPSVNQAGVCLSSVSWLQVPPHEAIGESWGEGTGIIDGGDMKVFVTFRVTTYLFLPFG